MNQIETLKESLKDWTDFDIAEYHLAVCLGMIKDTPNAFPVIYKHVFWSNNKIGNACTDLLGILMKINAIELRDEDELQYRWNKNFEVPRGWNSPEE